MTAKTVFWAGAGAGVAGVEVVGVDVVGVEVAAVARAAGTLVEVVADAAVPEQPPGRKARLVSAPSSATAAPDAEQSGCMRGLRPIRVPAVTRTPGLRRPAVARRAAYAPGAALSASASKPFTTSHTASTISWTASGNIRKSRSKPAIRAKGAAM